MNLKLFMLALIFSLSITEGFSQQTTTHEVASFSTDVFDFVSKLNNQIDSFFVKEKAEKLNRNLEYFKNDIRDYLRIRKGLMDYLELHNYNVSDNQTIQTISKLKKELDKLAKRLNDIRPYVSSNLSDDASDLLEKMYMGEQKQQAMYLTPLDELIRGENVDKQTLKKNGEKIYNELLQSIGMISIIQSKLQIKFNLQ